jgi:hypothetical protein
MLIVIRPENWLLAGKKLSPAIAEGKWVKDLALIILVWPFAALSINVAEFWNYEES